MLSARQPLEVWAREAGMEWEIKEAPVRFVTECAGALGAIQSYEDHKVLFRSDTLAPLSVVSSRYHVVQPKQILEFYRDLTEVSGFELETAGVLKGGRKLWALARTGKSVTLQGNDITRGYVLLATACDGTLATTAQFTSVRVVCNNTLAIAVGSAGTDAFKVPHSTRFKAPEIKQQLGIFSTRWDTFMDQLKELSERKVKTREAEKYLTSVFTHPTNPKVPVNERAMGRVLELFQGKGQGADLASAKGTAFGLLNAVTEYVDHERRARSTDYRLDSAWFGEGANLKQRAMDKALLLTA
jgi:phage/plasmid-like protein (TIGR03299 family)